MAKIVLCDAYGTLSSQQPEVAVLLNTYSPSALPGDAAVASCLQGIPSPEGFVGLALDRWSKCTGLASQGEVLGALGKLLVNPTSKDLKPAAKAFLESLRGRLLQLVQDSLARFGAVEGPVYDEVYGENADKSKIPAYLPVVSHFQLHFHDISNDKALYAAWADTLRACGAPPACDKEEEGLGSSPARRALVALLSMGEDIAFLRLVQVLLHGAVEFKCV